MKKRYNIVATILLLLCGYLHASEFSIITYASEAGSKLESTLLSIASQSIDDWHLYVVDDTGTLQGAHDCDDLLLSMPNPDKVTVLHMEKKMGEAHGLYQAMRTISDASIAVVLPAGDLFADTDCLKRLTTIFEDQNIWFISGNYRLWDGVCLQDTQPGVVFNLVSKDKTTQTAWTIGSPKVFRSRLFKKIRLGDLLDAHGQFLTTTFEKIYVALMLEMSGKKHYAFVPQELCVHDTSNTQAQMQSYMVPVIKKYECLDSILAIKHPLRTTLIVYSKDRPLQLYAFLESCKEFVEGNYTTIVIYLTSQKDYIPGYKIVEKEFPYVKFLRQTSSKDFKELTLKAIDMVSSDYILCAVDDILVKDYVSVEQCMELLESTGAYGVYLRLGTHVTECYSEKKHMGTPPFTLIAPGVHAWRFSAGKLEWAYAHTLDMTMYRTKTVREAFRRLSYQNPNKLEGAWAAQIDRQGIGLCFTDSKIVNIPINLVQTVWNNRNMDFASPEELLKRFMAGWKMFRDPYHQIKNLSPHIDKPVPTFVRRN